MDGGKNMKKEPKKKKWFSFKKKKLKNKFMLLYLVAVIIPAVLMDSILVYKINIYEQREQKSQLEISENEVISRFTSVVQRCVQMTYNTGKDEELRNFIFKQYPDKIQYLSEYRKFTRYSCLNYYRYNTDIKQIQIYVDNDTICDTDEICQLTDDVEKKWWYRKFAASEADLYIFEDLSRNGGSQTNPYAGTISMVRRIRQEDGTGKAVMLIDLNYEQLNRYLMNNSSSEDIYLCNNNRILFSNNKSVFEQGSTPVIESVTSGGNWVKNRIPLDGQTWTVVMKSSKLPLWDTILSSKQIFLVLLIINLIFPSFVIQGIVKSVVGRLHTLDEHFGSLEKEEFKFIEEKPDGDEIDQLFRHYNQTVERIKKLIETIIRKNNQQHLSEVSKKQAELNALNTQVNPHFMYNTLECICMRSMIKGEKETANVVRSLSALLRQMSKWNKDALPVEEEMDLVEKYLTIQKYRFDDRLSYELEMAENCKGLIIPKLTLVSFVENACVHGIEESVDGGTISVRVIEDGEDIQIIIKDTGDGMTPEKQKELMDKLEKADINVLYNSKSTGILNAYIRLKMHFPDELEFHLESTKNVGTCITIWLKHVLAGVREENECTRF